MTPLQDVELDSVGVKVVFVCEVSKSGLRPQWFKGDKALKRGDKYDIVSDNGKHSLIIESAQPDNIGEYTVKFDGVQSTAQLTIKGKSMAYVNHVMLTLVSSSFINHRQMKFRFAINYFFRNYEKKMPNCNNNNNNNV